MKRFLRTPMLILGLALCIPSFASHYLGGEIRWDCLPNGNYRFEMIAYRECAGVTYPFSVILSTNAPCGDLDLHLYPNTAEARTDLSPNCMDSLLGIHCDATPFGPQAVYSGAVERWVYSSDQDYPNGVTLNGIPPSTGWYFQYEACCRNPCTNIPNASSKDMIIRSVMYPYHGRNANPCFDHSPRSLAPPQTIVFTGQPISFQQFAGDPDGEIETLSFSWAKSLHDLPNVYPINNYNPGFSFDNPFPNSFHHPNNIGATMDPSTGIINLLSNTQGSFTFAQGITSKRNGIKTAEVFREFVLSITVPTIVNSTPKILIDNTLIHPNSGIYQIVATPGDTVRFNLSAIDTSMANPSQIISVLPSGKQFSSNFTDPFNCDNPPCAVLAPPIILQDSSQVSIGFEWPVTLNHLLDSLGSFLQAEQLYRFFFEVSDNVCPIPQQSIVAVDIKVMNSDFIPPVKTCLIQHTNNDVELRWDSLYDPNSQCEGYVLYQSDLFSPNMTLVDTIINPNAQSFTHNNPNLTQNAVKYTLMAINEIQGVQHEVFAFNTETMDVNLPDTVYQGQQLNLSLFGISPNADSVVIDPGSATLALFDPQAYTFRIYCNTLGQCQIKITQYMPCGISEFIRTVFVKKANAGFSTIDSIMQIGFSTDGYSGFWLSMEDKVTDQMQLKVYSMSGKLIDNRTVSVPDGEEFYSYSYLPKGIYIAVLNKNSTVVGGGKFLIQ